MAKIYNITIIGAGLGGLAVACRLAKLGHKVTIIEQNNQVGGKASELFIDGFRFDRGPSFMTMIDIFEDLFNFCGAHLLDYIPYKGLDETVEYYWPDKTQITTYQDLDKTVQALCDQHGEDKKTIQNYLSKIKLVYDLSKPYALDKAIDLTQIFNPDFLKTAFKLSGLGLDGTLARVHSKVFSNPKSLNIFNRWAAYVYSDPYKIPSILGSVGWAELGLGLYLPNNGIHSIATGIARLAKEFGVKIILDTKVVGLEQLSDKSWQCDTISLNGRLESNAAEILISNLDIRTTYKHLLKTDYPTAKKTGGSYLIYYWGIKHHPKLAGLKLHNIFFGDNSGNRLGDKAEFFEQFDQGRVPENPMVYLNITSGLIEADSPIIDGQKSQNWIVIISAPPDNNQINWVTELTSKKTYIAKLIAKSLEIDPLELLDLIVCQKIITPPDIQDWTGSYNGDLSGMRIESIWDVLSRPKVKARDFDNLYFVGGSVNPGPGMPMVLLSAKHCVEEVLKNAKLSY